MYDALIDDYAKLSDHSGDREETYFEICSFPHYENVVSNVLAFFLDHENHHNLNGLVITSLLEAAGILDFADDLQFSVDREVKTSAGTFIDILLANDTCSIVIENKIWAKVNNDLSSYLEHAESQYEDRDGKVVGILLSMEEQNTDKGVYINVTYSKLLSRIRDNIGAYISHKLTHNFNLLVHLVDTLENLERGVEMNDGFVEFLGRHPEGAQNFAADLKEFRADLRNLVKRVESIVVDMLPESDIRVWHARRLPNLHDICVVDFTTISNDKMAIDSEVDFEKWEFKIFSRDSRDLKHVCRRRGIEGDLEDDKFVLAENLPLDADATDVAKKIVELIKAIRGDDV